MTTVAIAAPNNSPIFCLCLVRDWLTAGSETHNDILLTLSQSALCYQVNESRLWRRGREAEITTKQASDLQRSKTFCQGVKKSETITVTFWETGLPCCSMVNIY
jgi:hypothetical protein